MNTTLWHDEPTVFAVEREPVFCQTLRRVVRSLGFRAEFYASAEEFLQAVDSSRRGCLAIDPQVPRWSAGELFAKLAGHGVHLPVVIVSARSEVPAVVAAIRAGALNYLEKPCEEETLAAALREAVAWDADHRQEMVEAARIRKRMARLTPGERQVLDMLVDGMSNKAAAAALGRSVRAIEVRRAKIREKMRAKSLADLVRQALITRYVGPERRPRRSG
jgi:FixJ family two-component response regulator